MRYKNSYFDCITVEFECGKNRRKSAARRVYAIQRRINPRFGGGRGWRKYDNPTPKGFKPMTRERFLGQTR